MKSFLRDTRGSVLIVAGVCFMVLVAVGGAGFDFARRELVRLKLQQATDAAALAGALLPIGTSDGERRNEVMRYYRLNFPARYLNVQRPDSPSIAISSNVSVTAALEVPTSFIENLGIPVLPARGHSVVTIGNTQVDFDLVMVVDESDSNVHSCPDCSNLPRIVKLRDAVLEMLDTVFPGAQNPNVRMGLIGYSSRIINKWGLTSDKAQAAEAVNSIGMVHANYDHYGLAAAYNMATGNTDTSVTNGRQASALCGADNSPGIRSFLQRKYGSSNILDNYGILWNYPGCTPEANTSVPPPRSARADGEAISKVKNVVLITDGSIMFEPSPCIIATRPSADNPEELELYQTNPGPNCPNYPAFLAECDKLKNAGVTVFTISYVSQAPGDVETLKSCASINPATGQPRYFFAPGSDALKAILRDIGITIRKVRIAE